MSKRITIHTGGRGQRLGEAHPRAKLSDEDVELIRAIYEEGMESLSTLAHVFGVSKGIVGDIVSFRRRATTPLGSRTLYESELKKPLPKSRMLQLGIDIEQFDSLDDFDNDH